MKVDMRSRIMIDRRRRFVRREITAILGKLSCYMRGGKDGMSYVVSPIRPDLNENLSGDISRLHSSAATFLRELAHEIRSTIYPDVFDSWLLLRGPTEGLGIATPWSRVRPAVILAPGWINMSCQSRQDILGSVKVDGSNRQETYGQMEA
jgi:hypothetical protein